MLPLEMSLLATPTLRVYLLHEIVPDDLAAFVEVDRDVSWLRPTFSMFGRRVERRCETATFGPYSYRGGPPPAVTWPRIITELGDTVTGRIGKDRPPDVCVANRYLDGADALGWHTDDETSLGPTPTVATLSLGGERDIDLRVDGERVRVPLASNSLLVFDGEVARIPHRIPPEKHADLRISLSFRWKGEPT